METFRGWQAKMKDLLSSFYWARPARMDAVTGLYFNPHTIHKNRENITCVLSTVTWRAPTRFLLHCHGTEKPPKLHKVPAEARGNPKKKSPKSILQTLQRQTVKFWAEVEFCRNVSVTSFYREEVKELKQISGKLWSLVLQSQVSHRANATRLSQVVDHCSKFTLWHSLMQAGIRLQLFLKYRSPLVFWEVWCHSALAASHWLQNQNSLN